MSLQLLLRLELNKTKRKIRQNNWPVLSGSEIYDDDCVRISNLKLKSSRYLSECTSCIHIEHVEDEIRMNCNLINWAS